MGRGPRSQILIEETSRVPRQTSWTMRSATATGLVAWQTGGTDLADSTRWDSAKARWPRQPACLPAYRLPWEWAQATVSRKPTPPK